MDLGVLERTPEAGDTGVALSAVRPMRRVPVLVSGGAMVLVGALGGCSEATPRPVVTPLIVWSGEPARQALGSGLVNDTLGNVALVLTVLGSALVEGAATLADDAGAARHRWSTADAGMSTRAR